MKTLYTRKGGYQRHSLYRTGHHAEPRITCLKQVLRARTISISGPLSEHTGYDSGELGSGRSHPGRGGLGLKVV